MVMFVWKNKSRWLVGSVTAVVGLPARVSSDLDMDHAPLGAALWWFLLVWLLSSLADAVDVTDEAVVLTIEHGDGCALTSHCSSPQFIHTRRTSTAMTAL